MNLQFDSASITTVGVLVRLMLALASIQSFALTTVGGGVAWISAFFGVLLLAAAVFCFISPQGTFAALADILGFVFLFVGVRWMIEAFLEREFNSLWRLWLVSGILMIILAFWTAGQFFIDKAYVLLVFARRQREEKQLGEVGSGVEDAEQQREQRADESALARADLGGAPLGHAPRHLLHRAQPRAHDRAALHGEAVVGEPVDGALGFRVGRVRRYGAARGGCGGLQPVCGSDDRSPGRFADWRVCR